MKLEDILRIKKTEKPTAADWQKFDVQLQRKMLLAIVRKEPLHKRIFAHRSFRTTAYASLLVPLFALPMLFSSFKTEAPSEIHSDLVVASISALPSGLSSFAVNEMSADISEIPVTVALDFSDNSRIRYLSSAQAVISVASF